MTCPLRSSALTHRGHLDVVPASRIRQCHHGKSEESPPNQVPYLLVVVLWLLTFFFSAGMLDTKIERERNHSGGPQSVMPCTLWFVVYPWLDETGGAQPHQQPPPPHPRASFFFIFKTKSPTWWPPPLRLRIAPELRMNKEEEELFFSHTIFIFIFHISCVCIILTEPIIQRKRFLYTLVSLECTVQNANRMREREQHHYGSWENSPGIFSMYKIVKEQS